MSSKSSYLCKPREIGAQVYGHDSGDVCGPAQVMSLVNELGSTEDLEALQDAEGQDAQALFHRAGLMLRLDKQVCPLLKSGEKGNKMAWFPGLVSCKLGGQRMRRVLVVTVIKVTTIAKHSSQRSTVPLPECLHGSSWLRCVSVAALSKLSRALLTHTQSLIEHFIS